MVLRLEGIWVAGDVDAADSGEGEARGWMSPRDGAVLVRVPAPCRALVVGVLQAILAVLLVGTCGRYFLKRVKLYGEVQRMFEVG